MKKRNLATLAALGVTAGLTFGCQQSGSNKQTETKPAAVAEQMKPDMAAFYKTLSPEAQKQFDALDADHKEMAVEMANQSCNGKNKCSGMGGCASEKNSCAGQNSCKGEGGAPVKNADEAVEAQYDNQMKGRQESSKEMNGSSH